MKFKKIVLSTLFAALTCTPFSVMAMEGDTAEVPEEVSNSWLYEKTLGEHPGAILLIAVGAFGAHVAHQKYKNWHNNRARIRRQLWEKIQQECYDFTKYGNSKPAQVRDFTNPQIANALIKKKNDWLKDAQGVYSWGVLQDTRLTNLIEEFFTVLKAKSSGVQDDAAAHEIPWYYFWAPKGGERLLSDILIEIEECLMGSCS